MNIYISIGLSYRITFNAYQYMCRQTSILTFCTVLMLLYHCMKTHSYTLSHTHLKSRPSNNTNTLTSIRKLISSIPVYKNNELFTSCHFSQN